MEGDESERFIERAGLFPHLLKQPAERTQNTCCILPSKNYQQANYFKQQALIAFIEGESPEDPQAAANAQTHIGIPERQQCCEQV